MKRLFLIIFAGYGGALISVSAGLSWLPYACVAAVALYALMERQDDYASAWVGLSLGFFFDVFSGSPRGLWIASIVSLALITKYIARTYVRLWHA
ncbi:hypothetical protein HY629_02595 [Candidatus Uhrbacteria bacterium]|nr:hypothetical protein [Candidatus Uhrbacteria bacterium]